MSDKIHTLPSLLAKLAIRRPAGSRVVFTNGCFDVLHIGHTRYLQAAKALGDILVVAVNSDRSVRILNKGPGRPIIPEAYRMELLAALSCVDYVVLFHDPDPLACITAIRPEVLVKGGDWPVQDIIGREFVESLGGKVTTIPLVSDWSTTALIQYIQSLPPASTTPPSDMPASQPEEHPEAVSLTNPIAPSTNS